MQKYINSTIFLKALGIGIAIVQLLDILLHAATNQLEILRVSSNIIMLAWLGVAASGRFNTKFLQTALGAVGAYLILNIIFLMVEGVTNQQQGGGVRVTLLLLIFLTTTLSALFIYLRNKNILK